MIKQSTIPWQPFSDKHKPKVRHTRADQKGQASFYICPWDDIRTKGYKILEYNGETCEKRLWEDKRQGRGDVNRLGGK